MKRHRFSRMSIAVIGLVVGLILPVSLPFVIRGDPPTPVGGPPWVGWNLAFNEDFAGDKNTLLSSGTWHAGWFGDGGLTSAVNSRETALLTAANLTVADGRVQLDVTPNSTGEALPDGTTAPNLGAALNTDESQASQGFMFTYGYVEARMQLPAGNSSEQVWPSFWLTGHTWPHDMEIDVLEGDGTDQGCKFNIHYGDGANATDLSKIHRRRTVEGATTGMHTYGADIRPDGVTFYYDGVAVYEYKGQVPDARRFLMIGVSSEGIVSSRKSLEVDYVRAWIRPGPGTGSASERGSI